MPENLTPTEIRDTLRSAFRPLRCEAETEDFGTKVRFTIFDGDRALSGDTVEAARFAQPDVLGKVIGRYRRDLEARGYELEEWNEA
jgi:hypothetical protein